MKLVGNGLSSDVTLVHRDKEVIWNISFLDSTDLGSDLSVFKYINQYWESLPFAVQDELFALYQDIRYHLDDNQEMMGLIVTLQPLVARLMDKYHSLRDVKQWIQYQSDIIIPSTVAAEFVFEDGSPATPDKTYLIPDYQWLISMSLGLRAMIPIWGEFIYRTKNECGTNYKEYYAAKLLNYTALQHSEPMEKLLRYVENQLPPDRPIDAAIVSGIGSLDFLNWMQSRVLVRRVCVGDISGANPATDIIKYIFKYIRPKNSTQRTPKRGKGGNFNTVIQDKFPEIATDEGGDNKLSFLEGYKIQEQLPRGDIILIQYFLSDPFNVIKHIEPDVDLTELLSQSLESIMRLKNERIDMAQITLSQWILKPAVSPLALATVNKETILKVMAVTQTVLWHRGHRELAALSSAFCRSEDVHRISMVETRSNLTRELHEKLNQLFPYHRRNGRYKTSKAANPAVLAINNVADELSSKEWVLTIPDAWIKELTNNKHGHRYNAPFDIKIKLANLICQTVQYRRNK